MELVFFSALASWLIERNDLLPDVHVRACVLRANVCAHTSTFLLLTADDWWQKSEELEEQNFRLSDVSGFGVQSLGAGFT